MSSIFEICTLLYDNFNSKSQFHHEVLSDYARREINAILWILLIAITALLLRRVTGFLRLWSKGSLIPGPPCPSFYGHSKLFSCSNLTDLLSRSHEKYGPVVKLWLGPTQLLVSIKDPDIIKEMLLKAEDKLPLTGRAFRLAFGRSSLFDSSFDKVDKRRTSLAAELNGKLFERANTIPAKVMDCVMERMQSIMAKGGLDCEMVSQHLAFTIMGTTLFGDLFLAWSKANVYEELLMKIAKDACHWASYKVTPFWKRGFWRYQKLCTRLKYLTQDIIGWSRQNYKSIGQETASSLPHSSSDVMPDHFLWDINGNLDAREEPCGNVLSVMFHGSLATSGLIGNVLARLVTHPEIQDKILSEIIMVRKGSDKQDKHAVCRMPFLLATVYESARLLHAGPLLQRCSLKHDLNLKVGITIPAGATLVVPVQLVQMDNSSWGSDASLFNPYRFLSKPEKKSSSVHVSPFTGSAEERVNAGSSTYILKDPNENAAFLPFGSGARACIGQKTAILGVAMLFASLLEHYEVRLQPGSESDLKPMMNNCVLRLLPSPKIVFVKRDN